jgi:transposase
MMEDVLDVYQRPYDPKFPQVCLDETGKELRSTPKGHLAAQAATSEKEATPAREDYEWKRAGMSNLFLWVEPLTGRRGVSVTDQRTGYDFAEELRLLVEERYPEAEKVVLVTDNLNTHKIGCLYERFAPEHARRIAEKIEWHYTPPHGSWLNMAECEISAMTRQCLNRRIADKETLTKEVKAWVERRNKDQVTIQWRFTTADARIKLRRLYPVTRFSKSQTACDQAS